MIEGEFLKLEFIFVKYFLSKRICIFEVLCHSSWLLRFFLMIIWYWARIFQVFEKRFWFVIFLSERICIFGFYCAIHLEIFFNMILSKNFSSFEKTFWFVIFFERENLYIWRKFYQVSLHHWFNIYFFFW